MNTVSEPKSTLAKSPSESRKLYKSFLTTRKVMDVWFQPVESTLRQFSYFALFIIVSRCFHMVFGAGLDLPG